MRGFVELIILTVKLGAIYLDNLFLKSYIFTQELFLSPLLSCGETINKGEWGQVGLLGTPFLQLGCLVCVSFGCVLRAHLLPWVESKQR